MSLANPIPRQTRQAFLIATAAQSVFGPLDFVLFDAADMQVRVKAPAAPDYTLLGPGTFTVTPAAPATAFPAKPTVTLVTPRGAGDLVWIKGARIGSRTTDVTRAGVLQSQPLEGELDRAVATEQELRRDIDALIAGGADLATASGIGNDSTVPGGSVAEALNTLTSLINYHFDTIAALQAANVPAPVMVIELRGYYAIGDGGQHRRKRDNTGDISSADGAKWRVSENDANVKMFGAKGSFSNVDEDINAQAFAAASAWLPANGGTMGVPYGRYHTSGPFANLLNKYCIQFVGAGPAGSARATVAASEIVYTGTTGPLVRIDGTNSVQFKRLGFTYNSAAYVNGADLIDTRTTNVNTGVTFDTLFEDCVFSGWNTSSRNARLLNIGKSIKTTINRCYLNNAWYGIAGAVMADQSDFCNNVRIVDTEFDAAMLLPILGGGLDWRLESVISEPPQGQGQAGATPLNFLMASPYGLFGLLCDGVSLQDGGNNIGAWLNFKDASYLGAQGPVASLTVIRSTFQCGNNAAGGFAISAGAAGIFGGLIEGCNLNRLNNIGFIEGAANITNVRIANNYPTTSLGSNAGKIFAGGVYPVGASEYDDNDGNGVQRAIGFSVPSGGTGRTTFTAHGIVLGEGTSPLAVTAAMTGGQLLVGQTGADPLPKTVSGDITLDNTGAAAIGAHKVTRAMQAQGAARSVTGVTGNATADLADIQGTASQFLGVNSAGTAVAFQTMSGDGTLAGGALTISKTGGASFAPIATSGSASDLSAGTVPAARLPNPSASTLGGVQSITATASQFLTSISTLGVPSKAQPSVTDLSDGSSGTGAVARVGAPTFTGTPTAPGVTSTDTVTVDKAGGNLITARYNSGNARIGFYAGGSSGAPAIGYNITFNAGNTFNIDKTGDWWLWGNVGGSGAYAVAMSAGNGTAGANADYSANAWLGLTNAGVLSTYGPLYVRNIIATLQGSVALANGLNSNIAKPTTSWVKLTGPTGAFSVGGFTGGVDGSEIDVFNSVAQAMTIVNEDASSTAGNRISTLTGANVVLRAGTSAARFKYDAGNARWILISTN